MAHGERGPLVFSGAPVYAMRGHFRVYAAVAVGVARPPGRKAVDRVVEYRGNRSAPPLPSEQDISTHCPTPGAVAVIDSHEYSYSHVVAAGVVHKGVAPSRQGAYPPARTGMSVPIQPEQSAPRS